MTSRPSTAAPILAALAVVLVMLGAYVGGYFWLGHSFAIGTWHVEREFTYHWQKAAFSPLGWLESTVTGVTVELVCPNDDSWHEIERIHR